MKKVLFVVLCFLGTTAFAQTNEEKSVKIWTLKECVDYALANNLDVQRSQYNVENTEIDHDLAKMAMLPNLNASISNGYNWGRTINPGDNEFTTEQVTSLNPGASSSVTLFNGFRLQNTVKQTSRSYMASEQDLLKAKNDVILNVVNLYINVIFNQELLENAKFQLASSQRQLERTQKQVAAGALPKSNELNLDAQVATNELNVINNENSLNLSILQLKQALQLTASTPMRVEIPEVNVEDLVIEQSSEEIYDIARQAMPEVKSAELKVRSSFYALRAARGNLYPRLSLNGSIGSIYSSANDVIRFVPNGGSETIAVPVGYFESNGSRNIVYNDETIRTGSFVNGYGYRDQFKDRLSRSINITLSIPLFNGLQTRSNIRRSVIDQRMSEISAKQVDNTLRQNVETSYNDALAASKSYNSSVRQVQAREEAFRITQQRYENGAANYVEYQVAENDLFQSRSDLTRAKYNFLFRKKLLDFYQGKPLGF